MKGRRVRAWLTSAGISITPVSPSWWPPWAALRSLPAAVCYEDILSASVHHSRGCGILTALVWPLGPATLPIAQAMLTHAS